MNAEELPPELAQRLLSLPPNLAVVYYGRAPIRWHARATYYAWDVSAGEVKVSNLDQLDDLASALDADSFVTLPVRSRDAATGRLYLTGPRRIFRESDVAFLLHILDQLMPVLQNIRLIERLAKHAAEEERLRIARDIHDSVVQPYIGLQLGIAALGETAGSGIPGIKPQIDRLMEMTRSGIADLRRYIRGLEEGTERECSLKLAICRFADRFTEATGIDVQVEAEDEIPVQDRLVAEAFQIVTEGLANIRRHTEARHAVVRVACRSGKLMLEIENDGATGLDAVRFVPHTIQGRAEALGGEVRVERREPARICVMVSIPL